MTKILHLLFFASLIASAAEPAFAQSPSPPQFAVCQGTYALCTSAVCKPRPGTDMLECGCTVNQGYSLGKGTTCPPAPPPGAKSIPSRYFPMTSYQVCIAAPTSDRPWADCLDMPCTVDPGNPTVAQCECKKVAGPIYEGVPSFPWLIVTAQAGPNLCNNSTIYSSAALLGSSAVTQTFNDFVKTQAPYPISIPTQLQPQP